MEDLNISPWENYEPKNKLDFSNLFNKPLSNHHQITNLKNIHLIAEQNSSHHNIPSNQQFILQIIRKKGQSLASSENNKQRKICTIPKKLQIKLLSYPVNQKLKTKQVMLRYSQKLQTTPQKKQFEAIQTVYNSDQKKLKIFKSRSSNKYHTLNQQIEKMQKMKKYDSFETQSFKKIKSNNVLLDKGQISNHENHFKMFNMTLDPIKFLTKSSSKQNLQTIKHHKSFDRPKLKIQKLQNIDQWKENSNLFKSKNKNNTSLKKKNKNCFNQLEKYNLFGLKKLNKNDLF